MPLTVEFANIDDSTSYEEPRKLIHTEGDVETFRISVAYARLTAFIAFLSDAMPDTSLETPPEPSTTIRRLLDVLETCEGWLQQCPPHTGARRFGNLAFREWHKLLESESYELIGTLLPESRQASLVEIVPYFQGSFGSAQRLDYGTGHELSFIAFICCLYQMNVLKTNSKEDAQSIGLLVYPAYLRLIQTLVVKYTLEPAGSHGVWGLDDHFAMAYLLGAAQLSHLETSVHPTPASITNARDVKDHRNQNLYFNAIGFINDVKKGPFWEHSPMLYDISGIDNWDKIAQGMRKMYNVEVMGKFPVVQHFPFGPVFFPFTQQLDIKAQEAVAAMTELQQVRDRTKTLHVSEYERDRRDLNADTPVPDDTPTHTVKTRNAMPPPSTVPPTSVPWKKPSHQISTAAPWTTGTARHISGGQERLMAERNNMRGHSSRHPDSNFAAQSSEPETASRPPTTNARESAEEQANTEGLEDGIGVDGLPGTKAPFAQPRTIHPAVLASMKARGETPT